MEEKKESILTGATAGKRSKEMTVALWKDKAGICGQEVLAAITDLHWCMAPLLVAVLVLVVFGGGALAFLRLRWG